MILLTGAGNELVHDAAPARRQNDSPRRQASAMVLSGMVIPVSGEQAPAPWPPRSMPKNLIPLPGEHCRPGRAQIRLDGHFLCQAPSDPHRIVAPVVPGFGG